MKERLKTTCAVLLRPNNQYPGLLPVSSKHQLQLAATLWPPGRQERRPHRQMATGEE